jgi:hypothetical protein
LVVANKFKNNEFVMALDADTICTRPFTEQDISPLFRTPSVLLHQKEKRWLAGLVAFDQSNFRYDFADRLISKPIEEWEFGRDQDVLDVLSNLYNYAPVTVPWVAIGKSKSNEVFITLKGSQKTTDKYLSTFLKYRICTPQETGRV